VHKPNFLLESDVREELDWDPLLNDDRIVVKADDGRVILSGAVDTFDEIDRAVGDAWGVGGVKAVDMQLLVGLVGDAITDLDIGTASAAALEADRFVPKGAVTAEVKDGFVTLTGQVRRHFQRKAAEHAVGRVAGVRGITDQITLTDEPIPSDVAARINRSFERNAVIDESLIKVSNEGHTIYLDGTTSSYVSMEAAVSTAWDAPGVTEVVNRLMIIS
jgi:osmotically-inducible protein OsmY